MVKILGDTTPLMLTFAGEAINLARVDGFELGVRMWCWLTRSMEG